MSASERAFGYALRLVPRSFRERHGDEMRETHGLRAAEMAESAMLKRAAFVLGDIWSVVWLAVRLRTGAAGIGRVSGGRKVRRAGMLDGIGQDVRFGARALRRSPGYAWLAVVVLALGIGASTAIFSAVNAFFFRPLPFADPDRLVMLYETNPEFDWTDQTAAPANYLDWREQVSGFTDIAAYSDFVDRATYVLDGEPVLLTASAVTGNFFDVLGIRPLHGRGFRWEETWAGTSVVVLSHALWLTHFGGDPRVIGRSYDIGNRRVEVVGVMPEGFGFPSSETQLWHPWGWTAENRQEVWFRRAHFVRPIARLAPGVTFGQAVAELESVVQRLQREYPETNSVMGAGMMPLRDFLIRQVKRPLLILFGAVTLLLLLACANVANLTLVRGVQRGREMALRHALGAGRLRMARQLLIENLVLALAGGALGIALGWAGLRAMAALTPLGIDGATTVALDGRVILFTLAATIASGILFGLAPAIRATAGRLHGTIIEGGTGASPGRSGLRMVRTLVAVEVTLALLLTMGAGLMMRSFLLLRSVDPGFRTEGVLAVQVTAPSSRYAGRDEVLAFQDRLAAALEARAGIERAGLIGQLPLAGPSWSSQFQARGWPPDRVGFEILHRRADAGYFAALDIPLVRGRMFEPRDGADAPRVVLINETFAREHFPGEDPIGQRIAFDRAPTDSSVWHEIIGIVADQHQQSPGVAPRAEVFESRHQDWWRSVWVVMRTRAEPMSIMPTVRAVLREVDPLIPVAQARPLREVWRASMAREEFILSLLGAFGVVALLLATVGVYAVTAQAARRRTREIGIRMALGAGAGDVMALMLRHSLVMVGAGLAGGLAISLAASRALGSVLYGVAPNDPLTAAAVVLLLALVATLASWVPARRATSVDPARTLKQE